MVAIKKNLKQHKKRIMAANVNTGCLSSLFFWFWKVSSNLEAYPWPQQTSKMESFATILNGC